MTVKKYIASIANDGLYVLDTASWRTERPVMDKDKCIECGMCLVYCPVCSVKGTEDKKYYIDYSYCKGCGICVKECPTKAIDMIPEEEGVIE
jgi:pyruvate ferredoxin oxidoreductase delta subunit